MAYCLALLVAFVSVVINANTPYYGIAEVNTCGVNYNVTIERTSKHVKNTQTTRTREFKTYRKTFTLSPASTPVAAPTVSEFCDSAARTCADPAKCTSASIYFQLDITGVTSDVVSENPDDLKCALGTVSKVTSESFKLRSTNDLSIEHLQADSTIRTTFSVDFKAEAYDYTSKEAAIAAVTKAIQDGVGEMTTILQTFPPYSGAVVTFATFPGDGSPTISPTGAAVSAKASATSASSKGSSLDMALVIGLSAAFGCCICLICVACLVASRRNQQGEKGDNLKNMVNFSDVTGVIPRDEDVVEWGLGLQGDSGDHIVAAPNTDSPVMTANRKSTTDTKLRRGSDLFVF